MDPHIQSFHEPLRATFFKWAEPLWKEQFFFFSQENQFFAFFSKKEKRKRKESKNKEINDKDRERRKQAFCLLVLNPKGLA